MVDFRQDGCQMRGLGWGTNYPIYVSYGFFSVWDGEF